LEGNSNYIVAQPGGGGYVDVVDAVDVVDSVHVHGYVPLIRNTRCR
jgi:hypothetical protein